MYVLERQALWKDKLELAEAKREREAAERAVADAFERAILPEHNP